jgi:outer membrane protein TolC
MGVRFDSPIPGFNFPTVVGPFNFIDLRARLSQAVLDLTALNNYRSAKEGRRGDELAVEDARELIALAVGGAYLQVIAGGGRVESARAQLETAEALYKQNVQRREVGLAAQVAVDRSQVQVLTQQQRLIALQNDLAKQKINLARMIGLPPSDRFELIDQVDFAAAPPLALDEAVERARATRNDLKAAAAQLRAAERALDAARAERLPSVAVSADYGTIGQTLSDARSTFTIIGTVRVPIWQGGRTEGHIQEAEAAVRQRRAELDDLGGQIEADVRKADLDVRAASSQVELARQNLDVARNALSLTRQRFEAGITDNVEVVQAQEAVVGAEMDYVNGVFAHNLAKLTIARTIGQAVERLAEFLPVKPR